MKGYKFLLDGYKSQHGDFTYKIGKTYVHNGEIELCKSGFHFSKTIEEAIQYVNSNICVEIEASGEIIEGEDKYVCSEIKIIRELNIQDVLKILSENEDWRVKKAIAENLNTPIEILEKLSEDKNWWVREAVAENQNTPIKVLEKLSEDKDWWIRENAINNLKNRNKND